MEKNRAYDTAGRIETTSFSLAECRLIKAANCWKTWINPAAGNQMMKAVGSICSMRRRMIQAGNMMHRERCLPKRTPKAISRKRLTICRAEYNAVGQVQLTEAGNGIVAEYRGKYSAIN
ncbi:hypothetical protein [Paenibacillus larvae]|uniref:hypothetical protein n=1 Tax=Paenibacillus larvae TaxID=1464 RepID=UPI001E43448F|nr:hypothetical protein [Paenibacillus larvae]MCY7518375.1 hypothetical protein [Paenibacillus larvae]MCY9511048.1 hypothetical protein [Paenibacillus larvae]MCY9747327.1 hypothetical protein [Paenibacillus larvae]MEC0087748.1 hypothetical protein [Paenibacillus larvae]MEC0185906.1 hypothetical protein [Paenibacillus larvae]